MGDVPIRVEGLAKQYRIGALQECHSTLRDPVQKRTSLRGLLSSGLRESLRVRAFTEERR
jgi:hypothetical protein